MSKLNDQEFFAIIDYFEFAMFEGGTLSRDNWVWSWPCLSIRNKNNLVLSKKRRTPCPLCPNNLKRQINYVSHNYVNRKNSSLICVISDLRWLSFSKNIGSLCFFIILRIFFYKKSHIFDGGVWEIKFYGNKFLIINWKFYFDLNI